MASPNNSAQSTIDREALARLFLDGGDQQSALEVCEIWSKTDPDDEKLAELRAAAEVTEQTAEELEAIDAVLAEQYLQQGFVAEAHYLYGKVAPRAADDEEIQERLALLEEFLTFDVGDAPHPLQTKAESQVAQGRVAEALITYYELTAGSPDLAPAAARRDQLRAVLAKTPKAARPGAGDRPFPPGRRHKLPVRTEHDMSAPPGLDDDDEREWIDPLDDTMQFEEEELADLRPARPRAKTIRSVSPMVLPEDEEGMSVVEVAARVSTAIEQRTPDGLSVTEAAEIAEPLGVIIRPIRSI